MKIVRKEDAEVFKYADTSNVLEYSLALNEKNMDFCINSINGRYPMEGYASNTVCEELCYVLDGSGKIYRLNDDAIEFKKEDIIHINKGEIYYWEGNFKVILVCTPAWSKDQCLLYDNDGNIKK